MRIVTDDSGLPVYDANGRVRVDCGTYEDWCLPSALPPDLQETLLKTVPAQSGPTPLPAQDTAVTGPPASCTDIPVAARELAAALASPPPLNGRNGGGRPISPEEQAARLRQEQAKAQKLEAEAAILALRQERERLATEEARQRHQADTTLPTAVYPPAPTPADRRTDRDPVAEARRQREIEENELAAYRARLEREDLADRVHVQKMQDAAGSPLAPAGWGCLAWFAAFGLMSMMVMHFGAIWGPMILPVTITAAVLAVRWARGKQTATMRAEEERTAQDARRAEYERRTAGLRAQSGGER